MGAMAPRDVPASARVAALKFAEIALEAGRLVECFQNVFFCFSPLSDPRHDACAAVARLWRAALDSRSLRRHVVDASDGCSHLPDVSLSALMKTCAGASERARRRHVERVGSRRSLPTLIQYFRAQLSRLPLVACLREPALLTHSSLNLPPPPLHPSTTHGKKSIIASALFSPRSTRRSLRRARRASG
jgi:hypothetical protein